MADAVATGINRLKDATERAFGGSITTSCSGGGGGNNDVIVGPVGSGDGVAVRGLDETGSSGIDDDVGPFGLSGGKGKGGLQRSESAALLSMVEEGKTGRVERDDHSGHGGGRRRGGATSAAAAGAGGGDVVEEGKEIGQLLFFDTVADIGGKRAVARNGAAADAVQEGVATSPSGRMGTIVERELFASQNGVGGDISGGDVGGNGGHNNGSPVRLVLSQTTRGGTAGQDGAVSSLDDRLQTGAAGGLVGIDATVVGGNQDSNSNGKPLEGTTAGEGGVDSTPHGGAGEGGQGSSSAASEDQKDKAESAKPAEEERLNSMTLCPALHKDLLQVTMKIFDLNGSGTVTREVCVVCILCWRAV